MRSIEDIMNLPIEELTEREKIALAHCKSSDIMKMPRESLNDVQKATYDYWSRFQNNPTPIPEFCGEYVHIYKPQGDIYRSKDHPIFETGTYFDTWVPNDFSIINHEGVWHMIGITHPRTPEILYRNEFDREHGHGHEAEWQLFHASAKGNSFSDVFSENAFADNGNILATCDRPEEQPDIWAPSMIKMDDGIHLVYGPERFRQRITKDFSKWEKAEDLFVSESKGARDINIYEEDGIKYFIYVNDVSVVYRTSTDFKNWSEEKVLYTCNFANGDPESPFLIKKDGFYYLFWCLYDGKNGVYDNRTFVFASKTLEGLKDSAPITILPAHAPEIICDGNGDYYLLSVYYPNNGVSAVKLEFKTRHIPKP